jgi:hypothetical protein
MCNYSALDAGDVATSDNNAETKYMTCLPHIIDSTKIPFSHDHVSSMIIEC